MGDLTTVSSAEELSAELGRLRRELQAAKAQLDSILRGSTGYAIVLVDSGLRLLHSNGHADELFSLGHLSAGAEVLDPAKVCSVLQVQSLAEIESALRSHGRWEAEVSVTCGSAGEGQPRQVQMVVTATAAAPQNTAAASGYLLIARDVSDQRRRERALLESQRMDSIGLLAGGIAHDFNNILMGILGYAGLAQDLIGRSHAAYRMLETIERSAERASYLTGQLLAYSRGGKMQSVYVNMDEMVADMLNIIGSNISKQINMVHVQSENLPWVVVDPVQFQQVIMNLCINASEAIAEKCALLGPDSLSGKIELSTGIVDFDRERRPFRGSDDVKLEGSFVYLQVADDGGGMSAETLAKAFEPFYTTKFTGRGLGLSAVEGIVRNHGGVMAVQSTPGVGTTFTIYLPAKFTREDEDEASELPRPLHGDETVLFIDDEPIARHLGLLSLANLGYRVLLAENGRVGLDVYRSNRASISLVVLDLTMPEMNGEQVLREMDKLHGEAHEKFDTAVLLISGFDETVMAGIKHRSSNTSFLQKPYTPEQLSRAVRELIDKAARAQS